MECKRFLVRGKVQGVGFRMYTQRKATELGLRGWVRNLSDGRVEAIALGSTEDLEIFEKFLVRGPDSAKVLEVHTFDETLRVPEPEDFQIRIGEG